MSSSEQLFSHASPVWPVKDMTASLKFYHELLGFDINFTWEEPITYAVLKRGDVGLHLSVRDDMPKDYTPLVALYIFVHDVDAMWEECQQKKVKIVSPIGDREYGMRDFDVEDLDGYRIVFSKSIH